MDKVAEHIPCIQAMLRDAVNDFSAGEMGMTGTRIGRNLLSNARIGIIVFRFHFRTSRLMPINPGLGAFCHKKYSVSTNRKPFPSCSVVPHPGIAMHSTSLVSHVPAPKEFHLMKDGMPRGKSATRLTKTL